MALSVLCSGNASNLTQAGTTCKIGLPLGAAFVPRQSSAGVNNVVSIGDTLNEAYFEALVNQTDPSLKWFPTGPINEVKDERGDPVNFTKDGVDYFGTEGNRTFSFEIVGGASNALAKAYNALQNLDMTMFTFPEESKLVGNGSTAGELRGFRIQKGTLYAKYVPKVYGTTGVVMVTFTISVLENDGDTAFLEYQPAGAGAGVLTYNVLEMEPLKDVTMGAATSITATTFTTAMTYLSGDHFTKNPYTGGETTDFTLYNNNTEAAVVVTAARVDNAYTLTFLAQTADDVLTLTFLKNGVEATSTIDIIAV